MTKPATALTAITSHSVTDKAGEMLLVTPRKTSGRMGRAFAFVSDTAPDGKARPDLRLVLQAVDDDLDIVLDAAVELEVVGQAHNLPVHARPDEAALEHVFEKILVLTFLSTNHRREHQKPGPLGQGQNPRDDLLARLRRDRSAADWAMAQADPRIQDAQVVVDFRNRADR